jgi:hypothetical protein
MVDAPPPFTEAMHPAVPQMVKMSGDVLATPKIVPIYFSATDTMITPMDSFLGQLAGSSYWTAIGSEYGVGALTIEPKIVTTDAAPTTDTALVTWLQGHFNGQNGWPSSPDPQAIYSVFLPAGATFNTSFGAACQAFGAYHDEAAQTGTNAPIIYALIPRCDAGSTMEQDELTESSSHEWIEAATDPRVMTAPAYGDVSADNYIWAYTPGAEVGDMCEYVDAAYQKLVGNFMVQRTWSNAAALAGHDPCVPAPDPATQPYLGVAPELDGKVSIASLYSGTVMTNGIQLARGGGMVVTIDLFSDADGPPWTVDVQDAQLSGSPELNMHLDTTTGANGDKLNLTITRVANGDAMVGGSEFVLSSKLNDKIVAQWWGFVAN